MRFCAIKIIFSISTLLHSSQMVMANDYDFSFDVRKPNTSKKTRPANTSPLTSTNAWRLGMQGSLLPNFLKGSGEILYSDFGKKNNSGVLDWDKYLLNLAVDGKKDIFGYGFHYFSVGQHYKGTYNSKYSKKKGKTGYETWLSINIEKLKIKTKYLESWTNTSNLTNNAYTFDNWYEIETSYPLTTSPATSLSFAYGLGERQKYWGPNRTQTYQGALDLYRMKFQFSDDYLKFSTELRQYSSKNKLESHKKFQQKIFYLTSIIFPHQIFSILSSYRYSIDKHTNSSSQRSLNKMESSFGLIYNAVDIPANLKLTSGYNNYRSDDGLTYKDIINFGAQLDWKSREPYTGLRADWTVNLRYKDTIDHINPATNSSGLSVNLLWQLPL